MSLYSYAMTCFMLGCFTPIQKMLHAFLTLDREASTFLTAIVSMRNHFHFSPKYLGFYLALLTHAPSGVI